MAKIWFRNDSSLSEFIPGDFVISVKALQPRIDDVTTRFLTPLIGVDTVTEILQAYDIEAGMDEDTTALYDLAAKAVAHLSVAISTNDLNVRASAGGFTTNSAQDSVVASAERVRQYQEARAIDGQNALDDLVKFLEDNSETYTTYRDCEERKQSKVHFVNSPLEMNNYLAPGVNRWVFKQIKPVMTMVEETFIKSIICGDLFTHLKEIIRTNEPNSAGVPNFDAYAPLIPLIQRAVSNLTLAFSVDKIGLKIDTVNGVFQTFYRNANEPAQSKTKEGVALSAIAESYYNDGKKAMELLKEELTTNVESYPLYAESNCYTAPKENYTKNETDNGIKGATFFGWN